MRANMVEATAPSQKDSHVPAAWHADPADLSAALSDTVIAPLNELGVIVVEGADAALFLQAQLTNDSVTAREQVIRNGYCTAKGRLVAVFDHWAEGDAHYLMLPREVLVTVMKRLSMFVLRAKVKLSDASNHWCVFGLLGPGADAMTHSLRESGVKVARQPNGTRCRERFLLMAPAAIHDEVLRLACARRVSSGVWWWSQIDAGVPTVLHATQEKFIPQMINLEVLGGVSFKKGCYPGQEIVARSQYLGKLRRRMHLAHLDGQAQAGGDVIAIESSKPVGTVVLAADAPDGGQDVLFESAVDDATTALMINGVPLTVRSLPYAIVDVTA